MQRSDRLKLVLEAGFPANIFVGHKGTLDLRKEEIDSELRARVTSFDGRRVL